MFTASRRMSFRWMIVLLVMCVPCCGPRKKQDSGSSSADNVEQRMLVQVQPLRGVPLAARSILPGEVEPWEKALVSAETSGRVEELSVEENDKIKEGQVVARIDSEALQAHYEAAEARCQEAVRLCERLEKLFELKHVTEDDIDKARAARRIAEAQLHVTETELKKSSVKSPLTGRVNKMFVEKGEFVNKGQPIAELVVLDRLKFVVDVPERSVASMDEDTEVSVSIESLSLYNVEAKVYRVALGGDATTNTFEVELALLGDKKRIKPGMIGRATFVERRYENTLAVPLFAVVSRGGEQFVFVAREGEAEARKVKLGVVDGDRVQVLQGLEEGDSVIVKGARDLDDGALIEVSEGSETVG